MVDTALFVGMSGAKQSMRALQIISNNLANANTVGFRADYETIKSFPTSSDKMQARVYSASNRTYSDFKAGPIMETGSPLDIALSGPGFIAVQTKEGKEAYTRAGNLRLSPQGLLMTQRGDMVLGSRGVISIPPATRIHIGERGMVTAQLRGQSEREQTEIGPIKLVEPALDQLHKGEDGLFYLSDEGVALASDKVRIVSGALEGSNVDPVKSLTEIIDISRQFEMHAKLMRSIEENSMKSNQLLEVSE
ncbi:flagellar basal-body rod protein FlgF [Legionella sp. CNM-4043-24]|uniref:flagellar basal-body rod protein FlgF n=1 Tax=Legionella sp. CNM-4043-24 TaxID=3421646 RepID=UPI00403ABB18